MRFRTAILGSTVLLVAGGLAATAAVVSRGIERRAMTQVVEDLDRSGEVFDAFIASRQAQWGSEARVTAVQPRLTAVVAAEDVDHETVLDQARDLADSLHAQVFLIADAEGRLLADVRYPDESGSDVRALPVVAAALERGESQGLLVDGGRAFLVQGQRLTQGDRTTGVLMVGHGIDDALADDARRQTGSETVVVRGSELVAASSGLAGGPAGRTAAAAAAPLLAATRAPQRLVAGGRTYLASDRPIPGAAAAGGVAGGAAALQVLLLRDLDRALAPGRDAKRVVWIVLVISVGAALVLALLLASALSRPVHRLVAFAQAVGRGDLAARAEVKGVHELAALAGAMNRMVGELSASRQAVIEKERLQGELEIATRVQTAILPRAIDVPGLDVAATMVPASEVGGDYYDVVAVDDGAWIGVGDVSGHGLDAGLVMLMAQTAVATLVRSQPAARPRDLVVELNRVLYDTTRNRMGGERHMTLSLLRYHRDGRVVHAGAHMDLVLLRAGADRCELLPTCGTWLAVVDDVGPVTVDSELRLHPGDLLVAYTDGLTEAMRPDGTQFGEARLCAAVEEARQATPAAVVRALLDAVAAWRNRQDDDVTVVAMRYRG